LNLLPYTQHNLPKSPLVVFQGNHKPPVSPVYVTQHQLDLKQSYLALLSQLTTPDPQQAGPTEMAMLASSYQTGSVVSPDKGSGCASFGVA
jgi:hypothetical protein